MDDDCCTGVLAPLSSPQKNWPGGLSGRSWSRRAGRQQSRGPRAGMQSSALPLPMQGDVRGQRKRKAGGGAAAACFCLGRFPRFIDAIVKRSAEPLEQAKAAI
jgi:hypothetical protein